MSNRRTNFEKLVRWDADWYKLLSDDDCIICISEREVYLIGQIVEMLKWKNTRWVGDLIGLDFVAISENLEAKLADRMTCTSITTLVEKISQLEVKINELYQNMVIDNGGELPTKDTTIPDRYSDEIMNSDFVYATDGCDTADKDALYSGIREFVNYVHLNNIDSLQNITQAGANVAQQAERLISGVPVIGLLPFDEASSYAAFLIDELLDEYEATVDEELLQTVICDLFCIAVNSDCTFKYRDAIDYFGSKIPSTPLDYASSIADIASFAATGTFTGDDYFYFMCVFQFIAVAISDHYFDTHGIDDYLLRVASGENSPDNDWTLLCDACPAQYRRWEWDFSARGQGLWFLDAADGTADEGEFTEEGWRTTDVAGGGQRAEIAMPFDPTWRVRSVAFQTTADPSTPITARSFVLRPTAGSTTGQAAQSLSNGSGEYNHCNIDHPYVDGYNEVAIGLQVGVQTSQVFITKVAITFEMNYAKDGSMVTTDLNLCD